MVDDDKAEEAKIEDAKIEEDKIKEDSAGEDFVMLEPDPDFKFQKNRPSFFNQMENALNNQIDKCEHYRKVFEKQNNPTMANKFAAYSLSTEKSLELLKASWKSNEILPKYKFETVNFNCVPINVEVKEKELQLVVKTSKLSVADSAQIYIIAEFDFPCPPAENLSESVVRWLNSIKVEPKNMCLCSDGVSRQLDMIYANPDFIPFTNPESDSIEYNRAISFYVDRGKSKTLKRKFKPIKLTFYEKTNFLKMDRKIGTVQVRIDDINDNIFVVTRSHIMDGRKQLDSVANIEVKVREPLLDKETRAHEEKMLYLT